MIYPCSKVRFASMWRELAAEFPIVATWINWQPESDADFAALWKACISEAASSNLVLYCEPGDDLKGAIVEVGACLAGGGSVHIVGDPAPLKTAKFHPSVKCYPLTELRQALKDATVSRHERKETP